MHVPIIRRGSLNLIACGGVESECFANHIYGLGAWIYENKSESVLVAKTVSLTFALMLRASGKDLRQALASLGNTHFWPAIAAQGSLGFADAAP